MYSSTPKMRFSALSMGNWQDVHSSTRPISKISLTLTHKSSRKTNDAFLPIYLESPGNFRCCRLRSVPNGIESPDYVVDTATELKCSEVPNVDGLSCALSSWYGNYCCPGFGVDGSCDFCPDSVESPDVEIEHDGETVTCDDIALS
eukprot:scaffold2053_cov112-Cylindrotheca_fusiformis.AAC.12